MKLTVFKISLFFLSISMSGLCLPLQSQEGNNVSEFKNFEDWCKNRKSLSKDLEHTLSSY